MKKHFILISIFVAAVCSMQAQEPAEEPTEECNKNVTATVTLKQRGLTQEEQDLECDNAVTAEFAFHRVPVGALPGLFSVSETKKVLFSKGNLQYLQDNNDGPAVWRFAEHQYDYIGSGNQYAQQAYNHQGGCDTLWFDLFGYGTSGQSNPSRSSWHPLSTTTTGTYLGSDLTGSNAKYDWGYNKIFMGGDTPEQWRTLSKEEWSHLLERKASDGKALYCKGRITIDAKTINGLFIFPDAFTDIEGITIQRGTSNQAFTANEFTLAKWETLEKVGVVFLPVAGYRDGTNVKNAGTTGEYWSSTYLGGAPVAHRLYFSDNELILPVATRNSFKDPFLGMSVRLVRDE